MIRAEIQDPVRPRIGPAKMIQLKIFRGKMLVEAGAFITRNPLL